MTTSPATTRLYRSGEVIADGFAPERIPALLDEHPDAVLWLDLLDPGRDELASVQSWFGLHPVAVEDAVDDHQRPKLDRYPDHQFLNVYAVQVSTAAPAPGITKIEISAFVTERALITVHKSAGDLAALTGRWDDDPDGLRTEGIGFLVRGLLDVIVDGHLDAAHRLDAAVDSIEDEMLGEGGAPRPVRAYAFALRRTLAILQRGAGPMPELVAELMGTPGMTTERLKPYLRSVKDHARRAAETVESARDRVNALVEADLNEQSNALNDTTRKLAAWAAIIAVPTAVTGFFGQNLPFPGYAKPAGVATSLTLILVAAVGLFVFFKKRKWL